MLYPNNQQIQKSTNYAFVWNPPIWSREAIQCKKDNHEYWIMSKNHPFSHRVVSPRCNQRGEVRKDGIADCVTQFPNQPHSENSESILGEFCLHSPSQFCNLSCCMLHWNQRKPSHISGFLHCRIPIDRWIWVVFAQCWPCRRVVGLGLKACSWCYWDFKFYNIIITIVITIIVNPN